MKPIKSVAIIGCGPAGAITIDALGQEGVFDKITVFERREKPGGCWVPDPQGHAQQLPSLDELATRSADRPVAIPEALPAWTPRCKQYRFSDTSIYPLLETNIAAQAMEFSQEPIPDTKSQWSVQRHGYDTPFRHHAVVQQYLEDLVNRKGYQDLVQCNTTVERVSQNPDGSWELILRKEATDSEEDYWWREFFDAVIDASGHYSVPFIPHIQGLVEFAKAYPGSAEHTKSFRGVDKYKGKKVVTVGASISGPDVAAALAGTTASPLHCVVRGKYHPYFGDHAFRNPHIQRLPPITHITVSDRTVHFEDKTSVSDVDHIIFGTGYSWTMHFLPSVQIRNNRIPGLYQHIFPTLPSFTLSDPDSLPLPQQEPTFLFVGAIAAGFTFKVYEWQAVLVARYLAGRVTLPSASDQQKWEQDRIQEKGDGVPFTALYPKFEEYFEEIRALAGGNTDIRDGNIEKDEAVNGDKGGLLTAGRPLPKFEKTWRDGFDAAHLKRINMWTEMNLEAEKALRSRTTSTNGHMSGNNGALENGVNGTTTN